MKLCNKRIVSGLLSVVLATNSFFGDFPAEVFAADAFTEQKIYASTSEYIADNLKSEMVKNIVNTEADKTTEEDTEIIDNNNGLGETYHYMMLHYTLMDSSYAYGGITIEDMYNVYPESFIADYVSSEQIYLVEDGDYFVGLADVGRLGNNKSAIYAQFSDGDVENPVIYDDVVAYDYSTGLIYIPKSFYYNEEGKEILRPLAVQVLVPFSFENTNKTVQIALENKIEGIHLKNDTNFCIAANAFANTISIPILRAGETVDINKLSVYLNDEALPIVLPDETYIDAEGVLVLPINPINTNSVRVVIENKDDVVALNSDILVAYAGDMSALFGGDGTIKQVITSVNQIRGLSIPGVKVQASPAIVGKVYKYDSYGAQNGDVSRGDTYYSELLHEISVATAPYNMTIDYSAANSTFTKLGTAGNNIGLQDLLSSGKLQNTPIVSSMEAWAYKLLISLPTGTLGNTKWTVDLHNGVQGVKSGNGVAGYPDLSSRRDSYFTDATGAKFSDGRIHNSIVAARCMDIKASSLAGQKPSSVYGSKASIYARCLYIDTASNVSIWSFVTPGGEGQGFGGIYAFEYREDSQNYAYRIGVEKGDETTSDRKPSAVFLAVTAQGKAPVVELDNYVKKVSGQTYSEAVSSANSAVGLKSEEIKVVGSENGKIAYSGDWRVTTTASVPGHVYVWVKEVWTDDYYELDEGGWLFDITPTTKSSGAYSSINSATYYKKNSSGGYTVDSSKNAVVKNAVYATLKNKETRYYGSFGIIKLDLSNNSRAVPGITFDISTSDKTDSEQALAGVQAQTKPTNSNGITTITVDDILTAINKKATQWYPAANGGTNTVTYYVQENKKSASQSGYEWNNTVYKVIITGGEAGTEGVTVSVDKESTNPVLAALQPVGSDIATEEIGDTRVFGFAQQDPQKETPLKGQFGIYKTGYGIEELKDVYHGISVKISVATDFNNEAGELINIVADATTDSETGLALVDVSTLPDATHVAGPWNAVGTATNDHKVFYIQEDKEYCDSHNIEWVDTIYQVVVTGESEMFKSTYYVSRVFSNGVFIPETDRTYGGTTPQNIAVSYDSGIDEKNPNYSINNKGTWTNYNERSVWNNDKDHKIQSCEAAVSRSGREGLPIYLLGIDNGTAYLSFFTRISNQEYTSYSALKAYWSDLDMPVRVTLQFSIDGGATWNNAYDTNVHTVIESYLSAHLNDAPTVRRETAISTITSIPDVWLAKDGAYLSYNDAVNGTNRIGQDSFKYTWNKLPKWPSQRAEDNEILVYRAVESGFAGQTWTVADLPLAPGQTSGSWVANSDYTPTNLSVTNKLFGIISSAYHLYAGNNTQQQVGSQLNNTAYYYFWLGVRKINARAGFEISGSEFVLVDDEISAISGANGTFTGNGLAVLKPTSATPAVLTSEQVESLKATSVTKTFYLFERKAPDGYDRNTGYWRIVMKGSRYNDGITAQDGKGSKIISVDYINPATGDNQSVPENDINETNTAYDERGYYYAGNDSTVATFWLENNEIPKEYDVKKLHADVTDDALPVRVQLQYSINGTDWTDATTAITEYPIVWLTNDGSYATTEEALAKQNALSDDNFYYKWYNLPGFHTDGVEYVYRAVETGIYTGTEYTWDAPAGIVAASQTKLDKAMNDTIKTVYTATGATITNDYRYYNGGFGICKLDNAGNRVGGLKFNVYTTSDLSVPASTPGIITAASGDSFGFAELDVSQLADGAHSAGRIFLTTDDTKVFYVQEDRASAESLGFEWNDSVYRVSVQGSDTAINECKLTVVDASTNEIVDVNKTDELLYTYFIQTNRKVTEAHVLKSFTTESGVSLDDLMEHIISVDVTLLADGAATDRTAKLTKDNDWRADFTGLDYYNADKEEVRYTFREDAITLEINGKTTTLNNAADIARWFSTTIVDDTTSINSQIINNAFKAYHGEGTIEAIKTLVGRELNGAAFTFTLTNISAPEGCSLKPQQIATNNGESIIFNAITFVKNLDVDECGTWTFTINEEATTLGGISIDSKKYIVTVEVQDEGRADHRLTVTVPDAKETVVTNVYNAYGNTDVSGSKLFAKKLKGGEFEFVITNTKAPEKCEKFTDRKAENIADGSFSFGTYNFEYVNDKSGNIKDMRGTWEFEIREQNKNVGFVGYDTKVIKLTMNVIDNGDGTLTVTKLVDGELYTNASIRFDNRYIATGSYTPVANKIYELPYNADEFEFNIELVSGPAGYSFDKESVKNAVDGRAVFSSITYNQDMLGTYVYKVTETKGENPHIFYDETVKYITVIVEDNVENYDDENAGKLTVTATITEDKPDGKIIPAIEFINKPITVEIFKLDIVNGEFVEGAKLEIYRVDDGIISEKPIHEWTSENHTEVYKGIDVGDYILVERSAPTEHGYVRAESVPFTVTYSGVAQKVEMKDDHTELRITKTDFVTSDEVKGATLELYSASKNSEGREERELYISWITGDETNPLIRIDDDGKSYLALEYIPVGEYVLVEKQAPEGYLIAAEAYVTVEETAEIQKADMIDYREHKIFTTATDDINKNHFADFNEIITINDEVSVTNLATGKEFTVKGILMDKSTGKPFADKYGNEVTAETTFTANGAEETVNLSFTFETDLEMMGLSVVAYENLYYNDYLIATHSDIDDDGQTVTISKLGYVEIYKKDNQGNNLEGVVFTIKNRLTDEVVAELTTDENGYAISELLPVDRVDSEGKIVNVDYILEEIYAPAGFAIDMEPEEFVISSEHPYVKNFEKTDKVQRGKLAAVKKGLLPVGTTEVETAFGITVNKIVTEYHFLEGAEFTIYSDAECTEEVGKIVTDSEGLAESEYLNVGTYFVKETYAPSGFAVDERVYEITIEGKDNGLEFVIDVTNDFEDRLLSSTLQILKTDSISKKPIANVFFGVFAAEDIANIVGDTVILKDECIAIIKTDKNGYATMTERLPAGNYYYRELKTADDSYILDTKKYEFEINYEKSEDVIIERTAENMHKENAKAILTVQKLDQNGKPLSGAEFTLTNLETGESWIFVVTDGTHEIKDIPVGYYNEDGDYIYYSYKLVETKAPAPVMINGKEYPYIISDIPVFTFEGCTKAMITSEYQGDYLMTQTVVNKILGIEDISMMLGIGSFILALFMLFVSFKKRKTR